MVAGGDAAKLVPDIFRKITEVVKNIVHCPKL
jgi:hypothetical protein